MTHRNKVNWIARNNFLFWEQNNSLRRIYTPDPYFHVASVYSQGFSWIFLNFNTDEQDPQCPIFSCYNASIETKLKRHSAKAFNAFNVHNHSLEFVHTSRTKGYISRGCLIMPLFCNPIQNFSPFPQRIKPNFIYHNCSGLTADPQVNGQKGKFNHKVQQLWEA